MTPPLACFPFLMTLAALGVLIVLAFAAGVLTRDDGAAEPGNPSQSDDPGPNLPRWWVIALLFVWPPIVLTLLAQIWPE